MNWLTLDSEEGLDQLIKDSFSETLKGILIFKHSTRCSISTMAKDRLERQWTFGSELPAYYLDLISYRSVSNKIAEEFNVQHQSPQALLIKEGKCIYNASHSSISVKDISAAISES